MANHFSILALRGFPDSSVSKEFACNAGDPRSIPGLEDPLEKGKATHSNILAWRITSSIPVFQYSCLENPRNSRVVLHSYWYIAITIIHLQESFHLEKFKLYTH